MMIKFFKHINTKIGVIYRNYNSNKRYEDLVKIASICKKRNYHLFVSNDIRLALKIKADGIYIPSLNKIGVNYLNLDKKNFLIMGSAHNQKEINEKIKQNCKIIFLSPLFQTSKYRKNKYLGIAKFNLLTLKNNTIFYALGGIKEQNLSKLKILNAGGFGGVNIFQKKTGLKNIGRFFK